jgi:glycosyltransferase involved in cell wall biosynthesis
VNNVLHVIDTCGPGGAETVFLALAKGLDARRWRSFVAIPGKGWVYDNLVTNGFEPIITPLHGAFDLRYLARLCTAVRRNQIDLIQTHLFSGAVYGGLAGLFCGVPVISTLHGRPDLSGSPMYRAAKFGILRRAVTTTVFVSESLRQFFLASGHLNHNRTVVIADGIDASVFAPRRDTSLRRELGIGEREVLVGAVGNVRPAKSYDVLLRAAALLRQSPEYRFVVVGEAQGALQQKLLALRDQLGLVSTVTFTGFKSGVHHVMNNFDLYASTSSSEGFSLSVVQAMACGVPVVATKSGGPEEIITHDVDGLLVDINSPEQVAAAVHRLSNESATRRRLTEAGRRTVETRFTIQHMLNSYEHLYDQCLHAARVARAKGPMSRLRDAGGTT